MSNIITFENRRTRRQAKAKCVCGNHMKVGALACDACNIDLTYSIARCTTADGNVLTGMGEVTLNEYVALLKKHGIGDVGTCAICGGRYVLYGNNPYPVVADRGARCCHRCNDEYVIPARIEGMEPQYSENAKPFVTTTEEYISATTIAILLHLSSECTLKHGHDEYIRLLGDKHLLYDAAIQSLSNMTVGEFAEFLTDKGFGTIPQDMMELSARFDTSKRMGDETMAILQNSKGLWKDFFESLMEIAEIIVQASSKMRNSSHQMAY